MIALAVDMKGRLSFPHLPLAVHALHEGLLILNSAFHSSVSGTYAVMMARYSLRPLESRPRESFGRPRPLSTSGSYGHGRPPDSPVRSLPAKQPGAPPAH